MGSSTKEFPNEASSVRAARDFVTNVLQPQGLNDVVPRIVTSELATNVIRHARTPFTVTVKVDPSIVRIEVEDGAGAQKIATDIASDQTSRGLLIVEAAATSWGVEHRGENKAVWIELPPVRREPQRRG